MLSTRVSIYTTNYVIVFESPEGEEICSITNPATVSTRPLQRRPVGGLICLILKVKFNY